MQEPGAGKHATAWPASTPHFALPLHTMKPTDQHGTARVVRDTALTAGSWVLPLGRCWRRPVVPELMKTWRGNCVNIVSRQSWPEVAFVSVRRLKACAGAPSCCMAGPLAQLRLT